MPGGLGGVYKFQTIWQHPFIFYFFTFLSTFIIIIIIIMDSGLLAQIQKGKSLKKSQTNDRSAPQVSGGRKWIK